MCTILVPRYEKSKSMHRSIVNNVVHAALPARSEAGVLRTDWHRDEIAALFSLPLGCSVGGAGGPSSLAHCR